ncbi:hypothetical protein DSBG_2521 [Desulfosporosinus sp. BG]|nr:hypothetical protein DSBG_2521 [Desulfosporosinus sp. BG]
MGRAGAQSLTSVHMHNYEEILELLARLVKSPSTREIE